MGSNDPQRRKDRCNLTEKNRMSQLFMNLNILNSCAVIAEQDGIAPLSGLLRKVGVARVDGFTSGNEGFNAILAGSVHGALIDWNLKGPISGLAILTRIRRLPEFGNFPIIILIDSHQRAEAALVQDFPCTAFIEKPISDKNLNIALSSISRERDWYQTNVSKIENAIKSISSNPEIAAQSLINLLHSSPNPVPVAIIATRVLSEAGKHPQAHVLLQHALKRDPSNLQVLSALSRIYYAQGNFKAAIKALESAHKVAPKNIDRLNLLGELEVTLRKPESAIKSFQDALGMDQFYVWSKVGLTVAQTMKSNDSLISSFQDEDPSVSKIINNLGVVLARRGEFEKAIRYYLLSFAFLSDEALQTRVTFNMGLGFYRWGKQEQAKYWFERSQRLSHGSFLKAINFLATLKTVESRAGLPGPKQAIVQPPVAKVGQPMAQPKLEPKEPMVHIRPEIVADTRSEAINLLVEPIPPNKKDFLLLDEENTNFSPNQLKAHPSIKGSLDKMIDEIDYSLRNDPVAKKAS
jgi:tetratricopeptide (TPR) repeat protein